MAWTCSKCARAFTRKNQRHACGTSDRAEILRDRPPELVALYCALEKFAGSLGPVDLVTRERYAPFAELEQLKPFLREAYEHSLRTK